MSLGISKKCRAIAPSATFAIDAKARNLRATGVSVISFAAGEPDFDTPADIRNAMKEAMDQGMTHYTPVAGTPDLRRAISHWMEEECGVSYPMEQIVVSNGAKHSLSTLMETLLDDDDEVIVPTPCWVSYPEMIRMAGGKPIFVDCKEENHFLPDIEDIRHNISHKTKAFILTNPSNPCGCVWPKELLMDLGRLAVEKDFYVVADEIYGKLVYDGIQSICFASLGEEIKKHTIIINGVSKIFAMTGFRIGFAAGPADVINGMITYQSQATSAPNAAAQYAATVAYSVSHNEEIEMMRRAFEQRRDKLVELVNAIPGLCCVKPEGAFYVMMNYRGLIGKKYHGAVITDSTNFASLILDNAHVAVVPGNAFFAEGFVRLSYATSMKNIVDGLRRIAAFVEELEP